MHRTRPLITVASLAAAALAVSIVVPALRTALAQDRYPGTSVLQIAQLPAVEQAAAPVASPAVTPQTPIPQAPAQALPQAPNAAPIASSDAPPPDAPGARAAIAEQHFQLRTLTADQLRARVEQIFGRPVTLLDADGSSWMRFTVQSGGDAPVLIAVQPQTGEVRVLGRADQLRAWRELLAAVDAPVGADSATEVIAADESTAPRVRRTVEMMLAQAQVPAAGPGEPSVQSILPGIPEGLLGPVEIVNIEGTDLFIIQGNPRDVERALSVIRQIQEMSRVSEPQVVVRPLAHVDSQAIAVLLTQLFGIADEGTFSLGGYYGSLLALPLGRPNAVLLVGGPVTIAKVQEILAQLDAPVAAETTQFEVFPLKYASAEASQTVVEELFTALAGETVPPAFQPKALVIAELRTNSLIVRAGPSDMAEVRELVAKIDRPSGDSAGELRVFKLRHSLASTLAPVLQAAFSGAGTNAAAPAGNLARLLRMVTIDAEGRQRLESGVLAGVTVNADERSNALVVSAPPESMPLIATLIEQLDQPPDAVAELKVFTIENGDAVTLAEMLQELFGTGQQQGGGGAQGARAPVFELRFSVDERTNSIIAAGSADELLVVEAILLRLDAGQSRSRINRVYRLKNASANDVALALQNWLEQKREVEQTAPGVISPFAQLEREVVVVPEIASNSLIVSATPSYYEELEAIIQQLDEQAPMVMIQVLIGEVRLGDADEFGVELGLQDSVLFDRSLLSSQDFLTTQQTTIEQIGGNNIQVQQEIIRSARQQPGFNFGDPGQGLPNSGSARSLATAAAVGAQGLSSFAVNRVSPDLGFGGFVLSASSNSVSMLLRALQETRRIEILSRPQIMALDNQFGRSFVGEIVPFITESNINQFTGQPQNTVTPVPVGLELLVRPRISPEDLVVMEIAARKAEVGPLDQGVPISVTPNGDPINVPRINSTEAQTTVSAASGQTVVLSGLLTKRDEALHRRVPLLADIPLVGNLFRFDSTRLVRTELLIILTPHVVRSRADSERLKQIESARMSWCLGDVVDLHGPAGLRSRQDPLGAAEAEIVYPQMGASEIGAMGPMLGGGEIMPTPADELYLSPSIQPMPPAAPTLPAAR